MISTISFNFTDVICPLYPYCFFFFGCDLVSSNIAGKNLISEWRFGFEKHLWESNPHEQLQPLLRLRETSNPALPHSGKATFVARTGGPHHKLYSSISVSQLRAGFSSEERSSQRKHSASDLLPAGPARGPLHLKTLRFDQFIHQWHLRSSSVRSKRLRTRRLAELETWCMEKLRRLWIELQSLVNGIRDNERMGQEVMAYTPRNSWSILSYFCIRVSCVESTFLDENVNYVVDLRDPRRLTSITILQPMKSSWFMALPFCRLMDQGTEPGICLKKQSALSCPGRMSKYVPEFWGSLNGQIYVQIVSKYCPVQFVFFWEVTEWIVTIHFDFRPLFCAVRRQGCIYIPYQQWGAKELRV